MCFIIGKNILILVIIENGVTFNIKQTRHLIVAMSDKYLHQN